MTLDLANMNQFYQRKREEQEKLKKEHQKKQDAKTKAKQKKDPENMVQVSNNLKKISKQSTDQHKDETPGAGS